MYGASEDRKTSLSVHSLEVFLFSEIDCRYISAVTGTVSFLHQWFHFIHINSTVVGFAVDDGASMGLSLHGNDL